MSRLLLALCSFVLTVIGIALVGGDVGASVAPGKVRRAIGDPPSCTRPSGPRQIIQVAKKKPKAAKKATKKDDAADPAEKPETPAPAAAGNDDSGLKFSRDIAPILVANCNGCHSPTGNAAKKSKLDMTTFLGLKKGGVSGEVIVAGNPQESELVLRIKNESASGKKMPPGNQKNLGEIAIGKIEEWIKAGAVLDAGSDPKAKLDSYATTPDQLRHDELAKMKPAERDDMIKASGLARWKLADPKVTPDVTLGKNFIMFSSLPKGRAEATLKLMDNQVVRLKGLLGANRALDWITKPSLFVFNERKNFTEFVRGVEKREVEEEERSSADFAGFEAFVVVVDPLMGQEDTSSPAKKAGRGKRDEEGSGASRTLAGILTEQLAIGVLSKAGKPPKWISLGVGAYLEAQLEGVSPYIDRLRKDARELAEQGWQSKAIEAMGDVTKADEVRAVGYALVDWIAKEAGPSLAPFVREMLKGGDKLDDAITNVLYGNREQFLTASGEFVTNSYRGRR